MVINKLEQELNNKTLNSIYLLYGEEKYLLEVTVNKIKKIFGDLHEGINYCLIDEKNINNTISEIETPCFGFEKKLIIIKNAGLFKKEGKKKSVAASNSISQKLSKYIEENIKIINDSVVLVIIEENVENCILLDVLNKVNASICEFEKLKINELVARLQSICKMYEIQVDNSVLAYLVETSGTSMQNLINEIRKLIEYVGESKKITKEDVDKLAIPEVDNIIFNLTDSLGVRDVKKALETLKDLLYLKEPIQMIMVNLYRHFKKIYFIKIAEKQNLNVTEVLDLKPTQMFLVGKYKKQSTNFKEEEVKIFLRRMLELDEKSKNGNMDLQVGLESLLCSFGKGEA